MILLSPLSPPLLLKINNGDCSAEYPVPEWTVVHLTIISTLSNPYGVRRDLCPCTESSALGSFSDLLTGADTSAVRKGTCTTAACEVSGKPDVCSSDKPLASRWDLPSHL